MEISSTVLLQPTQPTAIFCDHSELKLYLVRVEILRAFFVVMFFRIASFLGSGRLCWKMAGPFAAAAGSSDCTLLFYVG